MKEHNDVSVMEIIKGNHTVGLCLKKLNVFFSTLLVSILVITE